ncbi:MAG: glycine C-acetyltransferase [Anaerolineales bacterium]|nr:glycine C-acetyltransferase [Anaerolineales bacterium]
MNPELQMFVQNELNTLREQNTYKERRYLESEQGPRAILNGKRVVMLCTNNYLGLANHPRVKEKAIQAVKDYGCGTASVPEVCGLTDLHAELCRRVAAFSNTEDALLYSSCSTANMGVVGALAGEGDVIISDQYNHASIIDGCRLSKARTVVFPHNDMNRLEQVLRDESSARLRMIVVDGVFSMEGDAAPLDQIVSLAEKYHAFTVVDESHAAGVLGARGAGTVEHYRLQGKVDVLTGTFGKALGGAGGGYACASREVIDYLYHRSRTFIFSNTMPPSVIATALAALDVLAEEPQLLKKLWENERYFRSRLEATGLKVGGGEAAILPILIGDHQKAYALSRALLEEGVFITAVGFPVVAKGQARLRAQVSAAHTKEDLDAVTIIQDTAAKLGII